MTTKRDTSSNEHTVDAQLREMVDTCIRACDEAELKRLPIGSRVRRKVSTLLEFQVAYTSKTWNEKKRAALDRKTLHKRPVYTVKRYERGWMYIQAENGWISKDLPIHYEIAQ